MSEQQQLLIAGAARRLVAPWLLDGIAQGMDGLAVVWHGDQKRWDWGVTLKDIRVSWMRKEWQQ